MFLEMKYFVLKPRSKCLRDPFAYASRQAILAYSEAIRGEDPEFAQELHDWAKGEEVKSLNLTIMRD